MSVIVIVLKKDSYSSVRAVKLHRLLGVSLQDVKEMWVNESPIFEEEIFEGDYQQHAALIRSILTFIDEEKLAAEFYEIPYGEKYAGNKKLDTWQINAALVERVLSAADEEVERQLDN